jgi:hypothetical protein
MIRILRAAAIIFLVGVPSIVASLIAIDLFGKAGSDSISDLRTNRHEYVFLSYLGSYSHAINIGASHPGIRLRIATIPIGEYSRITNNQTVSLFNSATIDGAGLFEFDLRKRGYYVISVELEGEFDRTDFSIFYSFTRSIQYDLLTDALPLLVLGMALLVLSFASGTRG